MNKMVSTDYDDFAHRLVIGSGLVQISLCIRPLTTLDIPITVHYQTCTWQVFIGRPLR